MLTLFFYVANNQIFYLMCVGFCKIRHSKIILKELPYHDDAALSVLCENKHIFIIMAYLGLWKNLEKIQSKALSSNTQNDLVLDPFCFVFFAIISHSTGKKCQPCFSPTVGFTFWTVLKLSHFFSTKILCDSFFIHKIKLCLLVPHKSNHFSLAAWAKKFTEKVGIQTKGNHFYHSFVTF